MTTTEAARRSPAGPRRSLLAVAVVLAAIAAACGAGTTGAGDLARTGSTEEATGTGGSTDQKEEAPADAEPASPENEAVGEGTGSDSAASPGGKIPPAVSELGRDPVGGGGNPQGTVTELLGFTSPAVGGPDIDGNAYVGRDVVLWFWAPWCSWCNTEAPRVSTLATEFNGSVEVVGMAGVSSIENMQDFVDRHELQHIDHVADLDGRLWLNFDVSYQPWWIFINDDGTVIDNWQGRLSEEEIRERMTQLEEL